MTRELEPVSQEAVEITDNLQKGCDLAFRAVLEVMRVGMTEYDVESALRSELAKLGIVDFWYDVPIMVMSGAGRFAQMADSDYGVKSPSQDVHIRDGEPVFVDIHPREKTVSGTGRWGNYARTLIVNPTDEEQVDFLMTMKKIQMDAIGRMGQIGRIGQLMMTNDVAVNFDSAFKKADISLVDVRSCYGHNMGYGTKREFGDNRQFLDNDTRVALDGQIWGIEPGGFRRQNGKILVARFEDCVHVQNGPARVLGNTLSYNTVIQAGPKPYSKPR